MYWILILMLGGDGKAMIQIPGYATKVECVDAGNIFTSGTFNWRSFVCIPSPKKEPGEK